MAEFSLGISSHSATRIGSVPHFLHEGIEDAILHTAPVDPEL